MEFKVNKTRFVFTLLNNSRYQQTSRNVPITDYESSQPITSRLNGQTTNNIATYLTNQVNNQSIIPSTDMIQLNLTLKMTTAQVIETSVTVNNNSPIQDQVHPDDQTQPTLDIIAKHFTSLSTFAHLYLIYDISFMLIQYLRGDFLFQCLQFHFLSSKYGVTWASMSSTQTLLESSCVLQFDHHFCCRKYLNQVCKLYIL